jgi:hypothetical protein
MTIDETVTVLPVEVANLDVVTFDAYRDIHKGIRAELFGVTAAVGRVDPGDRSALEMTAGRLRALVQLLISHAEHEDNFVQPYIEQHAPKLAEIVAQDHVRLEQQLASLEILSDRMVGAIATERRRLAHRLYLGMASFTAAFMDHQAVEELEVNPALSIAIGPEKLLEIDQAIVASIPPDEMAHALALMLPAMNIDDRAELVGGIKGGAPAEVFAQVQALAQSVLAPSDYDALFARLDAAA